MGAPDDRHPESGDASHFDFDDLVLDEDFIRSATISEASATARVERRRQADLRRSSRFPRPQLRRVQRTLRRWWTARPNDRRSRPAPDAPHIGQWSVAQWVAVVVALALAGLFMWALVDIGGKAHTAAGNPSAAGAAAGTASTPAGADRVGTCRAVQNNLSGNHIAATTVSCATEHSAEITGYDLNVPTAVVHSGNTAGWTQQINTMCETKTLNYTGGSLPPGETWGFLTKSGVVECMLWAPDKSGHANPIPGVAGT